ncbi:MAG: ATP-binding cassette domain-containing protein, partial [Candidatus Rokuibacteriota bacterium]
MPLFETRGLTKRFLGVTAVDAVDLSIEAGELVSLIGPNGSGKTTLFN